MIKLQQPPIRMVLPNFIPYRGAAAQPNVEVFKSTPHAQDYCAGFFVMSLW
jgi:hypothetical protein